MHNIPYMKSDFEEMELTSETFPYFSDFQKERARGVQKSCKAGGTIISHIPFISPATAFTVGANASPTTFRKPPHALAPASICRRAHSRLPPPARIRTGKLLNLCELFLLRFAFGERRHVFLKHRGLALNCRNRRFRGRCHMPSAVESPIAEQVHHAVHLPRGHAHRSRHSHHGLNPLVAAGRNRLYTIILMQTSITTSEPACFNRRTFLSPHSPRRASTKSPASNPARALKNAIKTA